MEIYNKMKAQSDKNNWKYVSEKLGTGHKNENCRRKVKRILESEEKEKYMKKASCSLSESLSTSRPSTITFQSSPAAQQTCKFNIACVPFSTKTQYI